MKQKITSLLKYFILVLFIVVPVKVDALKCTYEVYLPSTAYNETRPLFVSIKRDNAGEMTVRTFVEVDGQEIVFNGTNSLPGWQIFPDTDYMSSWDWKLNDDFASGFAQDVSNNGTCPDIVIANGEYVSDVPNNTIGIFPASHAINDGDHMTVSASNSEKEEGDNLEVVTQIDSCTLTVPILDDLFNNEDTGETMEVSFFLNSNASKAWSVNNVRQTLSRNNYQMEIDSNVVVRIDSSLLSQIYPDEMQLKCPETLYACRNGSEWEGFTYYNLSLTQACYEQERIGGASLDGLNQAIACNGLFYDYYDDEREEGSVYDLLQTLLDYIKILGPILVVILSAVDFIKAVASSDEDAMKKAQHRLVIRLIAALALFLIPTFVQLILELIGGLSDPTCLLE